MFQIKIDNTYYFNNIDLASLSFSPKREGAVLLKNTGVEALKMCYLCAIIRFVCGSITSTWSPEKCVIDIVSKYVCS